MVVRNVLPAALTTSAVREIAGFLRADLTDNSTWYRAAPELDGIVPLHHAQSLWDIRQSPNLYQMFAEFFGNPRLMVDINRCIFRPPVNPRLPAISHGTIHWDTDPRGPRPATVQAVVLLSDVARNEGGFQCIPEIYQNLAAWLEQYAHDDFDFFNPGLNSWKARQIEGKAGDVILWSTRLPHGTAPNLSNWPRIAAFVTMQPPPNDASLHESMKRWWLTKRAPITGAACQDSSIRSQERRLSFRSWVRSSSGYCPGKGVVSSCPAGPAAAPRPIIPYAFVVVVFSFSRCSRRTALRLSVILLPSSARTFTRI